MVAEAYHASHARLPLQAVNMLEVIAILAASLFVSLYAATTYAKKAKLITARRAKWSSHSSNAPSFVLKELARRIAQPILALNITLALMEPKLKNASLKGQGAHAI